MPDHSPCPCENPVASWTDRQLRWVPRTLLATVLFCLYAAFVHPPSSRHAVVAVVAAIVTAVMWLITWKYCRRELHRRAQVSCIKRA